MLSKLRPGPAASRGAGGGPGGNGVPLARGEATPDSSSPLPMKDDILHTLDSFGNENKGWFATFNRFDFHISYSSSNLWSHFPLDSYYTRFGGKEEGSLLRQCIEFSA